MSSQETFGQMLRRLRTARGLSVRDLAAAAMMSKTKLGRFEQHDGRNVLPDDAQHLDDTLEAHGALAEAARRDRAAKTLRVVKSVPFDLHRYTDLAAWLMHTEAEGKPSMRRRTFLAGAGLTIAAPGLALEATRHGLNIELAQDRAESAIAEWQEIVNEHGYGYMTTAPSLLLDQLAVDMIAIQYAVDTANPRVERDLRAAAALMAALTAMTLANLSDLAQSRRWWRTARRLADESGDPRVRIWVRGREVVRALYEQRSIGAILNMVQEAEPFVADAPLEARTEFLTGKAQALALAGRAAEAESGLGEVEELFTQLPTTVTTGTGSTLFGWPVERVLFTKSFVYSHTGSYDKAAQAQDAAIQAYPATYVRGPAQIELQRAICAAKAGDTTEAVRHAEHTLTALPIADHVRPIVDLGHRVLSAIAPRDHGRPEVAAYRELLHTPRELQA